MSTSIVIGPLALPVAVLALAIAIAAGWWAGERLARRRSLPVDGVFWLVIVAGLVAARLAFVVEYRANYADSPLSVLEIRDGGWTAWAGFAAAAVVAALVAARRNAYAGPLASGWAVALGLWLAAGLATSMLERGPAALPSMRLAALDGTPVDIAALKGRPVVLNLWATWCPPCRREMPMLAQAQQRHGDVQFVFIDQGESAAKVQSFLAANRLALRNVLLDPQGLAAAQFNAPGLPTTLFFDANGRLVATRAGAMSAATLAENLGKQ
jgi:thiol-disulfide isomerase/thioredoxin